MTLVDRIRQITKERGLTFKALEREAGLGNGTIKRWEVQSPRLDGLLKVAEYLQVSLDSIVYGNNQMNTSLGGSPLSDEEADLVAMFRLLPPHEKEDLFDLACFKYEKYGEKRTASNHEVHTCAGSNEKSGTPEGHETRDGTA